MSDKDFDLKQDLSGGRKGEGKAPITQKGRRTFPPGVATRTVGVMVPALAPALKVLALS